MAPGPVGGGAKGAVHGNRAQLTARSYFKGGCGAAAGFVFALARMEQQEGIGQGNVVRARSAHAELPRDNRARAPLPAPQKPHRGIAG